MRPIPLIALAVLLTACRADTPPASMSGSAAAAHATGHDAALHAAPSPDDAPTASTLAYQRVNDTMHAGMGAGFTGDADVDFMRGMIPHHQGAIDMAHVVLEHGRDPEVRALAQQVIAAQEEEIAQMQRWLQARGVATGTPMADPHAHH